MNILIVTENFIGYGNTGSAIFGGAEVLLYEYAKLLCNEGHAVTVLQFGDTNIETEFEGIKVVQIYAPQCKLLSKFGIIRRWHWAGFWLPNKYMVGYDWVHYHYHYMALPSAKKLKRNGVIVTGLSHGVDWDVDKVYKSLSIRNLRERFSFWLLKKVVAWTTKNLDKVWCNDYFFIHHVVSDNPSKRMKLIRIPNFADEDYFKESEQPNNDVFKILLPKMPSYDRGTDLAIYAVKNIIEKFGNKSILLEIVGDSSVSHIFKQLAESLHVTESVKFLGHKDHFSDLPKFYNNTDVVIVPSPWREATALAMLEGMATGRPVIACNIGGMTEVIVNDFNGVLIKPTISDLENALIDLMADKNKRARLGKNAAEWIRCNYTKSIWKSSVSEFFRHG